MNRVRGALLVFTAAGLAACGDSPVQIAPEAPRLSDVVPETACTAHAAAAVDGQLPQTFTKASVLNEAKKRWKRIQDVCGTALAIERTVDLINYSHQQPSQNTSSAANVVELWYELSLYVKPSNPMIFSASAITSAGTSDGAFGVIGSGGGRLIAEDKYAGLYVPNTAVSSPTAFGLWKVGSFGGGAIPLIAYPLFVQFECWPAGPDGTCTFKVPITTAVCLGATTTIPSRGGLLGSLHSGQPLKVRGKGVPDLFSGIDCNFAELADATQSPVERFFARAGTRLFDLIAPKRLEATHFTWHTGTGGRLSTWAFTDVQTFLGTFSGTPSPLSADVGTWVLLFASPGAVTIENNVGDLPNPPSAKMDQAGGTAGQGIGLELRGVLLNAPQPVGIYSAGWNSVVVSPNVGNLSFNIRDGDGHAAASISYLRGSSSKSGPIVYQNANGTTAPIGTWNQGLHNSFRLTLNYYTKTVTVEFGTTAGGLTTVDTFGFTNPAAANIHRISTEHVGNDVQTVGWDDVSVARMPDPIETPPTP